MSVGNDAVKYAAVKAVKQPGHRFLFLFLGDRSQLVVELYLLCEVNNLLLRTSGSDRTTYLVPGSVYGKAPKRQFHSTPIVVSGSGYTGK